MNTVLWIIQGILACMFALAGIMKSTQPREKLNAQMAWTSRFPFWTVRLVGISELLGAIGLIVPLLIGVGPDLTPLAAAGLALIQVFAVFHHSKYKENKAIAMNIAFMVMAVFVMYGRF